MILTLGFMCLMAYAMPEMRPPHMHHHHGMRMGRPPFGCDMGPRPSGPWGRGHHMPPPPPGWF